MTVLSGHFDSVWDKEGAVRREKRAVAPRRPKPRSLNTRNTRCLYRQTNQRLGPNATLLCACVVGVSPCILHHFVALCSVFQLSLVPHLAIGPRMTNAKRRRRCSARRPSPTNVIRLPLRGNPGSRNPQRRGGVAACRPRVPRHRRKQPKLAICFRIDRLYIKKVESGTYRAPGHIGCPNLY